MLAFTSPRFTLSRFTSPRFTSPRFTSPRFTSPRFTSPVQSSPVHGIQYAANLVVCKSTFYTFYTTDLRWNITIYHTDLGQNAVFHNFSRQIALSQYSGRAKPFKNFRKFPKSPIRPAGSRFYSASCQCGRVFEWTLIELRFNIITNLLLLFFVI